MFKEIVSVILLVVSFLIVGIVVSITNLDYSIASYVQEKLTNKNNNKNNLKKDILKNDNINAIPVEVIMGGEKKIIFVDSGTTELEVFSIMGGKVKNILTITNLSKIISNRYERIEITR